MEKYLQIKKIGKVITGKTPSTEDTSNFGGKYPFITPSDIKSFDEKYLLETERTLSEEGAKKLKNNILPKDTICFVCIGSTIGKMCLTNTIAYSNQQINSLIVNNNFDAHYMFYFLRYVKSYFKQLGAGTGSGKGIVNKTTFEKSKVKVETNKDVQVKMANILSAYDNLIENNKKRIRFLEQMAENLYKEWFVRFRFPGYEGMEFEEKKPRGWQVGIEEKKNFVPSIFKYDEFGKIGSFVRGKNITLAKMIEGNIPVISAGIQPSGFHNEANIYGTSLTISASGANAGYLQYHMNDIWAADCSYYQDDTKIWFVYNTLKYLQPVISNLQCGAAQPHVYPKNINKLCVLIPTEELIHKYNNFVTTYYEEIKILTQHNQLLTRQRDMLLPRLMNGKLEV